MQRAASLILLPPLLAELGVDLDAALEGTGVSRDQLRPDAFIPYASYLAILDNAANATGRDDIGLLLGRRQTLAALGPLGNVMRHAATLGEALSEFTKFQINNSTGGAVYLMRADHDIILGYGVYEPSVRISPHIQDMVLAVGCNLIAELTAGRGRPGRNIPVAAYSERPGSLSTPLQLSGAFRSGPDCVVAPGVEARVSTPRGEQRIA